jgi:hypothetical protein
MTIRDMEYDFKLKMNKVDSNQNASFSIPEIDWILNEAQELIVKRIAKPRRYNGLGFEVTQRSTDDIKSIVINNYSLNIKNSIITLPHDYWFFISGYVQASKKSCQNKKLRLIIRQHDDMFNESSFNKSSFEWREINGTFSKDGINLHLEDFEVNRAYVTYIKKLSYIHNAQDFRGGSYRLPSGELLTGSQDCELPEGIHREIVDLAVLIASGQIQSPGFQFHQAKANLNDLIN